MNPGMLDDMKRDGFISQLMTRLSRLEAFEREFRLKKFGAGVIYVPFGVYLNLNPFTTTPVYPYLTTIDRSMTLVSFGISLFVAAPNDGANYWTINLKKHPAGTTLNSINTSAIAAAAWTQFADTTFAVSAVGTGDIAMLIECVKTAGAPGALFVSGPLVEATVP